MKIFENGDGWDHKVNFVDENNVFVGYDLYESCCEDANWFIGDNPLCELSCGFMNEVREDDNSKALINPENYRFDKEYFKDVNGGGDLDEGGMVVFKLDNIDGLESKYLHIYNSHNGYYGHGFEFMDGDKIIQKEYL